MIINEVHEIELSSSKHLRYFQFTYPSMWERSSSQIKGRGYWDAISAGYFFHGRKNRNRTKTRLYYHTWWSSDEKEIIWRDPKINIVQLNSIWDFYKAIGYDYKKRKWT